MRALLVVAILFVFGCQSKQKMSFADSIELSVKAQKYTDSIIKKAKSDGINKKVKKSISTCPVSVKRSYITTESYGAKRIVIKLKNNSGKRINGIKVAWILYNNFDEEVDNLHDGGIAQDLILPNQTVAYNLVYLLKCSH